MRIPAAAAAIATAALVAVVPAAHSQSGAPLAYRAEFTSWSAEADPRVLAGPAASRPAASQLTPVPAPRSSVRNGLIGGVIGAAAGFVICTAISTIADDAAVARISTCTASGYALFMGVGFGAGFLIGSAVD